MKSRVLFRNKSAFLPGTLILVLGATVNFSRAQTADSGAAGSVSNAPPPVPVLQIHADQVKAHVSPMLYGLMTEEINYSYEGGLYGELIRNRTFKANPTNAVYWNTVGGAAVSIDTNLPLNSALNVSLKLDATQASKSSPAGIANGGYWASFYARAAAGFSGPLTASIESADGKTVIASADVSGISGNWKKFDVTLTTKDAATSKDNHFTITTASPGTIWFQQVSLFPPTFNNRPNGNRPDLMELLAAMHPKFLRLPGGNYLEGNTIADRFEWTNTIGDISQRPGHESPWGYWSTDGFGLLEFLDWCEDLHMEPVLAVYAGYSLRRQYIAPGPGLQPYVQDALDEIEYVTGGTNTTWGAQRAQDGHPAPFPLHYVEIGNEDFFDRSGSYEGRFAQFFNAIKAKYPNLQIIATTPVKSVTPDLVDEHYYESEQGMEAQSHMYDSRPRTGPKVFVGEWATRLGSPTPNMAGALGDAAWMCCMERNSDFVVMESYAPLFVNVSEMAGRNHSMQWPCDLIGYDALTSYGSPSYYAQVMFSNNHGDEILAADSRDIPTHAQPGGGGTQQVPSLFFDATRDSVSGTIFLKIVNCNGTPQSLHVKISGANNVESAGEAVVLKAGSPLDTNSIKEPTKIVPVTETVDGLAADFTRDFPPYSISILKLKAH
jgi:alpha-L-arabinofuranosidase